MASNAEKVISEEITPDGNVLKISAAPIKVGAAQQAPPVKKSIADLEKVDDGQEHQPAVTEEGNESVSFDQFLDVTGKPKPEEPPATKKIETTPKDETVTEIKPGDKVEDKTKTVEAQKVQPDKTSDSRDYAGIDEADVPHFKKMGNDAFNSFKPIYTAHKQLKTDYTKLQEEHKVLKEKGPQLPESYYEHPSGYLLDPEFQKNVNTLNIVQSIAAHWQKQYDDVAGGATEFDFLDIDQNGQLRITGKIPANKGSEAKLLTYINHANNQVTKAMADVQASAQVHGTKVADATKNINELRAKYFHGLYNTPENKAIYEPLVKQHLDTLPPQFRHSPIAVALAESFVMNQALAILLNQAAATKGNGETKTGTNGKTAEEIKAEQIRKGNPTGDSIAGDGTVKKSKDDGEGTTMDDFEAVKRGY